MLLLRVGCGGGVYIGISKNPTVTTLLAISVKPKQNSVLPICQKCGNFRNLGETDIENSVVLKSVVEVVSKTQWDRNTKLGNSDFMKTANRIVVIDSRLH